MGRPVPEPRHRCYFSLRRCLNTFCGLLLRSGLPNVVEVQPVFADMSIPFHSVDMYVYMFRCVPGIFQQDHCVASFAFICISWKMIWSSKKISKMSTTARCPSFPNCCTTTTQRHFSIVRLPVASCCNKAFGSDLTKLPDRRCKVLQQAGFITKFSFKSLVWLNSNGTCTRCGGAEGVRIQ